MGYYSNGTEGIAYEERYCCRCVHAPDYETGDCCPILKLHSMWNYEQFKDSESSKEKESILDSFIPREGIGNGQCRMFVEKEGK